MPVVKKLRIAIWMRAIPRENIVIVVIKSRVQTPRVNGTRTTPPPGAITLAKKFVIAKKSQDYSPSGFERFFLYLHSDTAILGIRLDII